MRDGKGSHSNWKHPLLENIITIARQDGEDAPRYIEILDRAGFIESIGDL